MVTRIKVQSLFMIWLWILLISINENVESRFEQCHYESEMFQDIVLKYYWSHFEYPTQNSQYKIQDTEFYLILDDQQNNINWGSYLFSANLI